MPNPLATEFAAVRDKFVAGETGVDTLLYRLVKRVLAADPEEALTERLDSRTERCLIAGWVGSRLAWLARERSDLVFLETAAAMIATMADSPHKAAAYSLQLERWPTTLPRLVVACRERINGTGEPYGWTERTLTTGQKRVALAYEATRRLSLSQGKLASVIEHFERESTQGYWPVDLVALLPGALAGISLACDDRRLEPVRARSYRFSTPHTVEEVSQPHTMKTLEQIKRRQQIAGRHAGYNPGAAKTRGGIPASRRRGVHE